MNGDAEGAIDAEVAILYLEGKRVLMAAQPPGPGQDGILRAIDEVIAEYRAGLE